MNSQDNNRALTWGAVISSIFLVAGLSVGLGMNREAPQSTEPDARAVAGSGNATAPMAGLGATMLPLPDRGDAVLSGGSASAATTTTDAPSTRVDSDVVTFFFASGKSDLAQGAREALGAIVRGVAAGHSAVISTFVDVAGDSTQNEALAQQRSMAVLSALTSLGIGEDKLQMSSHEANVAGKSAGHEVPRVEVRLQ